MKILTSDNKTFHNDSYHEYMRTTVSLLGEMLHELNIYHSLIKKCH